MTYPMVRRSRTGSTVLTSRLSTRMRPLVGTSRRLIMRMIVVFPEPDGPMKTQSSPPPTSRLTSSTARTVRPRDANTLETCSRAIMRLVSLFCGGDGVVLRPDGSQRMAEAADGGVPVTSAGPRASACLAAGLVEGGQRDMSVPSHAKFLIIGAGVHGLSTGYHLARELRARGTDGGADGLIVDKTGIAAGASGIACGVIRNNYF